LAGSTAIEKLGINGWSRGRDWRASGFYGHYVTYAEALQLILALALGLFVSLPLKRNWSGALLLITLAGLCYALMLTVTRASWFGFLISCAVILFLGTSRRTIVAVGALAIPFILAGLFVLQQKRNVAFFDPTDGSTTWRETVWREGFVLLVSKPRHLLVGVGMDSIKGHRQEWGLFDHGRLPMGHMHSNLLQLALERGVPALILWLALLALYARMLLRLNRELRVARRSEDASNSGINHRNFTLGPWIDRGIVLGAVGGLAGFFASGIVHYNWGDSEVVMIFYFIMGLSLVVNRLHDDAVGAK
jgi:O-antigen ligase